MQTISNPESPDAIVVSIVHTAPLVRAGVAATLSSRPNFSVQVGQEIDVDTPDARLLRALIDVDVVVADYDTALAMARVLNRNSASRHLPTTKIVVVTQRDRESDIRHALELGVQGYLSLGCGLEEMAEGVMAVHRGRRHLGQSAAHRIAESFGHQALTSREIDVLRLVVAGYANKMVANQLEIALGTVKCHVKSILEKLGAKTRTEAAAVAQRRGLCGHERDVPAEWTSEWGVPPSSQSNYATHIRLNEQAPLA